MSRSVLLIAMLGLVARVALMAFESGMTYDGTYYLRQAERLASGSYEWIGFPPGYPLAIVVFEFLVRNAELAARLVSLAAGVGTVVVFHVWARRALDARFALGAALLVALHPELVRASTQILSESWYVFLVLAGVVVHERRAWLASLLLGLAFLCRPEALIVLVGLPLAHAWRKGRRPSAAWLLGFVLVATYATFASQSVGHFVISPKQGQLDLDTDVWSRSWTLVRTTHAVFPLILVPGALWVGARHKLAWLVPCLYVALLPLYDVHVQPRMLLPALPFLVVLAAASLQHLATLPRRAALAAAAALLVWGVMPTVSTFGSRGVVTPRAREIGAALAEHLDFEDRVAGRFPFVAYYAGAGFVRLPLASYAALMDSIVAWGATHLVVLESEMKNITPHLEPLFDDAVFTAAEGRLEAVAWVDEPPGHRAILYRMRTPDVSRERAPVLRGNAQGVAWVGADLVIASTDGIDFVRVPPGVTLPDPPEVQRLVFGDARDPCGRADGSQVAFVQIEEGRRRLALYDLRTRELQAFDVTAADQPASPTFVEGSILYVRSAAPGGLRVLDPKSGRVREVALQGLARSEATPVAVRARERDIALTYVRAQPSDPQQRVIATATWPASPAARDPIELPGRWATELGLADDHVSWLPGQRRVLASIGIRVLDAAGNTERVVSSIAIVHQSAVYRRLSFDLERVRRPAWHGTRLAFLSAAGDVRVAWIDPVQLEIPRTRVYESVLSAP